MPREREYPTNADRQRAHRQRMAERRNAPRLPQDDLTTLQAQAVEALEALEAGFRASETNQSDAREIITMIYAVNAMNL